MLSEDGKIILTILVFVVGIFACGYFVGWTRDKVTIRLLDAYDDMRKKRDQGRNRADYYQKELYKLRAVVAEEEEKST